MVSRRTMMIPLLAGFLPSCYLYFPPFEMPAHEKQHECYLEGTVTSEALVDNVFFEDEYSFSINTDYGVKRVRSEGERLHFTEPGSHWDTPKKMDELLSEGDRIRLKAEGCQDNDLTIGLHDIVEINGKRL